MKCCLDPAAWILPGEINAMENCAGCNEGLATVPVEAACDSLLSGVALIAHKALFEEEKSGIVPLNVASIRRRGYFQVE